MLKKELIDLIKDIENEVDIDETILTLGFAKPINDIEGLNKLLASNKEIQGLFDSKVSGGVDSFKKGGMQKLIDAEILKRTGNTETPQEIKIRELEERLNQSDKEKSKAIMVAKYKDTLSEKKIPPNMIDFLLGADEDTTSANITLFEDGMKNYIESGISAKLNNSSYIPPKQNENLGKTTKEDFKKMGYSDRMKLYNENPEEYKELSN